MDVNSEIFSTYHIRCITCNGPIVKYKDTIESMKANGFAMHYILDTLNIRRYCCRTALMTPINFYFNSENKEVVEGSKDPTTLELKYQPYVELEKKGKFKLREIPGFTETNDVPNLIGTSKCLMDPTKEYDDITFIHAGQGQFVPKLKLILFNAN